MKISSPEIFNHVTKWVFSTCLIYSLSIGCVLGLNHNPNSPNVDTDATLDKSQSGHLNGNNTIDYEIRITFSPNLSGSDSFIDWTITPGGHSGTYSLTDTDANTVNLDPAADGACSYTLTVTGTDGSTYQDSHTINVPSSSSSSGGSGNHGIDSIRTYYDLGSSDNGQSSGRLTIYTDSVPDTKYHTPEGIRISASASFEVIYDPAELPSKEVARQVLCETTFTDIVTIDTYKYEIRFYSASDAGTKSSGLYVPTGTPYKTVIVENPDGAAGFSKLKFTESATGGSTHVYEYSWDVDTQHDEVTEWRLNAVGLKKEIQSITWSQDRESRTETLSILNSLDEVVTRKETSYEGSYKIKETHDPGGVALETTYEYYNDPVVPGDPLPDGFGQVKKMTRYDGYWESYVYNGDGRITEILSPYADGQNIRTETITYSETNPTETRIITVGGQEIGRTYRTVTTSPKISE